MLNESQAVDAFAALGHPTRLKIARLLVQAGPDGLAAGAIGGKVGLAPSALSFHLTQLERAGLVDSRRESRSILYRADFKALDGLQRFLMLNCCGKPGRC